jgi:two-component sensor histidine kinase
MFNIGFDQLGMAAETAKKMTDPELMDTLTEEERRVIYLSGLSEFLFTMRLNDTDINRMFRRMSKDTQATAKEREAAIRKIRSGR